MLFGQSGPELRRFKNLAFLYLTGNVSLQRQIPVKCVQISEYSKRSNS